jgi:hypothetical protein
VPRLEYPAGGKGPPLGCFQQWPPSFEHVPVLGYGKDDLIGGVDCSSGTDGISCVEASGAEKGHGFLVSKEEAVELGGESDRSRPEAFFTGAQVF